ncbi:protein translocase subunit SecF [Azonexus hydrophilus]
MEFFRIKKDIPFMRHALVFNVISLITFVLAVFFLATKGLHLSVEFTGGTLIEVKYQQAADLEKIRGALGKNGFNDYTVQNFGSSQDVMIRLPLRDAADSAQQGDRVMQALTVDAPGASLQRVEYVGPQVGRELAENGALALLVVIIGIMIYLAFRFEWRFALSAIIANMHDVIIILGFFAAFQWEFSLSVLAAVLAVLGYSVNESVVVFDRVRETFKKVRGMTTPQVLDRAITSTISRTIITHGSTQVMVLSMLIFGGETLYYFSLALTIGILFGIYSSVLVASPLVMWLGVSREQFVKPKKAAAEGVADDGACVCGAERPGNYRPGLRFSQTGFLFFGAQKKRPGIASGAVKLLQRETDAKTGSGVGRGEGLLG